MSPTPQRNGGIIAKDEVATLEATREKLIKQLLEKKKQIEDQLTRLGYTENGLGK